MKILLYMDILQIFWILLLISRFLKCLGYLINNIFLLKFKLIFFWIIKQIQFL